MNNDERMYKINHLRSEITKMKSELYLLKSECHHVVEVEDLDGKAFGVCEICGEDLGWICKNSPDHLCHYLTTRDPGDPRPYVKLLNSKHYDFPKDGWEQERETEESCLYCGTQKEMA